jgi:hypothetical protein
MDWLTEHKIPVGAMRGAVFDWLQDNGAGSSTGWPTGWRR